MRRRLRHDVRTTIKALVLPTLAMVGVLAFVPGRQELALRVYALVVCAAALAVMVAALRRSYPPASSLRPPARGWAERREIPRALARIEQEVTLGVAGSFDVHHRLRPRLRSITADLLAARRGISLDGDPERARSALGDEAWDLVRADRPPPEDRLARGIAIQDLDRVVESLERL
jgi:hypothetical protein